MTRPESPREWGGASRYPVDGDVFNELKSQPAFVGPGNCDRGFRRGRNRGFRKRIRRVWGGCLRYPMPGANAGAPGRTSGGDGKEDAYAAGSP